MSSLRILRAKKSELIVQWSEEIKNSLSNWLSEKDFNNGYELSLISDNELEKQLAETQMAETFKKYHIHSINRIETFLKTFKSEYEDNLLHPIGFAKSINKIVSSIELPMEHYLIILKILERNFNKSLGVIYNKCFEVLQKMNLSSLSQNETHDNYEENYYNNGNNNMWEDQQVDGLNNYNNYNDDYLPNQNQPYNYGIPKQNKRIDPEIQAQLSRALLELFNLDNNVDQNQELNIPTNEFDDGVEGLLEFLKVREEQRNKKPNQKINTMSRTAVNSVLSVLQQDLPESVKEVAKNDHHSLTKRFKEEMMNKALQIGVREEDSLLNDKDEDAIDIVGMLFEIFLSERQIVSDVKENIAKLIAPYVKVALNDRKMFMHKNHPARRFLDVLAQACEGNKGVSAIEKNTLNKVNTSIDQLVVNFNEDLAIFELVESEVKNHINQQKALIEQIEKRTAEAQNGAERLEVAKKESLKVFEENTYMYPWAIQNLSALKAYWIQDYTMLKLRNEGNDEVLNELKEVLSGVKIIIENGLTENIKERLYSPMKKMLESSGILDNVASAAIKDIYTSLENAYNETPKEPISIIAPHVIEETVNPIYNEMMGDERFRFEQLMQYFKNLEIGTWVDFVKSDGTVINTKLSWISPISGRLLFVSSRGVRHAVESPEDLSRMVLMEKVRLRDFGVGQDAFERSFHQAIKNLGINSSVEE